jgi:hypothetical protein
MRSRPRQGMCSAATLRARRNWLAQAVHQRIIAFLHRLFSLDAQAQGSCQYC